MGEENVSPRRVQSQKTRPHKASDDDKEEREDQDHLFRVSMVGNDGYKHKHKHKHG